MKINWTHLPQFIRDLINILYAKRTADLGTMNEAVNDLRQSLPLGADTYAFISPDRQHKIIVTVTIISNTNTED